MKLITYLKDNRISCGILQDNRIIDIPSNWQGPDRPHSIKQILQTGESYKKLAEIADSPKNSIDPDSVKLLAPIPQPGKLIALAGNYAEHIKEAGLSLGLSDSPRKTMVPRPFIMPATVVAAPNETIAWPAYSKQIDYEIELAIVIGKKCKCIQPENASACVAGYTIVNDISARSITFNHTRQQRPWDEFFDWLNGKWADGFLPMGPYLITADEIDNVQDLDMKLRVNGEIRQKANTSQMIFPVHDIVSFLSHIMTLEPGDIIATGTPAGVGAADGRYLDSGDRIECTIEKLGTLTSFLGDKPENFYEPLKT